MKNRVNIDRDVQSQRRIAESRHIPAPQNRRIEEPPADEPEKEETKETTKAPEAEGEAAPVPAVKPKKSGRTSEGNA